LAAAPAVLVAASLLAAPGGARTAPLDRFRDACGSPNPFLVTTVLTRANAPRDPAIVAFHDSPDNAEHIALARAAEIGAAYGIAYDAGGGVLYASAFLKRGAPFGPGGPGAVYRLHPDGGDVAPWLVVPHAGPDPHDPSDAYYPDAAARDLVGKASLGDIDVSEDGRELFAMNLFDRRVYRFQADDGTPLGSFEHGAAGEPWAADARPFALAVRGGTVYHGVVNSAESTQLLDALEAVVYASGPDGRDMRPVTRFKLDYGRGTVITSTTARWRPWKDGYNSVAAGTGGRNVGIYPQPILADIAFTRGGDMVLGFRDRNGDMTFTVMPQGGFPRGEGIGIGAGDIVMARYNGRTWDAVPEPEHFPGDDGPPDFRPRERHGETSFGGLANLWERDVVAMTGLAPESSDSGGAYWFENASGRNTAREELYRTRFGDPGPYFGKSNGLGDLEVLCAPFPPTETPSATSSASATVTATSTRTSTATPTDVPTATTTSTHAPTATSTATATATRLPPPSSSPTPISTSTPSAFRHRVYLPLALRERCPDTRPPMDIVLVLDLSTSMARPAAGGRTKLAAALAAARSFADYLRRDPAVAGGRDHLAVVGFNATAWVEQPLGGDAAALGAALDRMPDRVAEFTRLDLALVAAREALSGPERRADLAAAVVMLTDGLPNRVPPGPDGRPETTVLAAAAELKARGASVFVIGLGASGDIHPDLLRAAASSPGHYFETGDAERLLGTYTAIAEALVCPPGRPNAP